MYDVNLYPPIFNQSYMPAFVITTKCKVYFEISSLNALDDLYHISNSQFYQGIQIVVRQQQTNNNALASKYLNEIMLADLQIDDTREGNDKYYIEINNSDINDGFKLNKYYKVQIRFTGSAVTGNLPNPTTSSFGQWLSDNTQNFSEWSSVVLIRGISTPQVSLNINDSSNVNVTISTDFVEINGEVNFSDVNDTEKLEKYRIQLYNSSYQLIQDSQDIYSKNNDIKYNILTLLQSNSTYTLHIKLTTNNLYEWSPTNRSIITGEITPILSNLSLQEEVDNERGSIRLKVVRSVDSIDMNDISNFQYYVFEEQPDNNLGLTAYEDVAEENLQESNIAFDEDTVDFNNNWQRMLYYDSFNTSLFNIGDTVIIRRASSQTNFSQWNEIANFAITEDDIVCLYWDDFTAEPGIWYRYQIIRFDLQHEKTAELTTDIDKPVMLDTQHIFLNANGKQLIIKFDPAISNISNKIAQSITETIGSKYPIFRRNGDVNYKTFSLSGTISCFMDIGNNVFQASKDDIYGSSAHFYQEYNEQQNINLYNDFIYQKHFRDKVIQFLQSSDVKLLRSITEGNILVKLSNITFTPNQTLGRKIYSFSCTVYEIADCNENNYVKFNIIKDNMKIVKKGGV